MAGYSVSLFGNPIGISKINKFRTEILIQPQLQVCPTSELLLLDFLTHWVISSLKWSHHKYERKKWFYKLTDYTFSTFLACLHVLQLCISMPKGKNGYISHMYPKSDHFHWTLTTLFTTVLSYLNSVTAS